MVALGQVEILSSRRVGWQHRRRFGALAQVIGRAAIPFLRNYIVPSAERVGADLLEFAVPNIAERVRGRKNFETVATSVD